MCTSNGKYRVRREKITKDASLIAIYRAKECNDLIALIYDVLYKIDLDENRKMIKKIKKSFQFEEDLERFLDFLVSKINKEFKSECAIRNKTGDFVLDCNSEDLTAVNCDYIRKALQEFYSCNN